MGVGDYKYNAASMVFSMTFSSHRKKSLLFLSMVSFDLIGIHAGVSDELGQNVAITVPAQTL